VSPSTSQARSIAANSKSTVNRSFQPNLDREMNQLRKSNEKMKRQQQFYIQIYNDIIEHDEKLDEASKSKVSSFHNSRVVKQGPKHDSLLESLRKSIHMYSNKGDKSQ
jgi:hypothetical protein